MKLSEEEVRELRRIKKILRELSREEYLALRYIYENISVGEILAERDLYYHHHIQKPDLVLRKLRERGLIERGEGCYNLAKPLRLLRKKIQSFYELIKLIDKLY